MVAAIDCGSEGEICIKGSKTNYVSLTQEGWDYLDSFAKDNIKIGGDHVTMILRQVIGFYVVRGNTCI